MVQRRHAPLADRLRRLKLRLSYAIPLDHVSQQALRVRQALAEVSRVMTCKRNTEGPRASVFGGEVAHAGDRLADHIGRFASHQVRLGAKRRSSPPRTVVNVQVLPPTGPVQQILARGNARAQTSRLWQLGRRSLHSTYRVLRGGERSTFDGADSRSSETRAPRIKGSVTPDRQHVQWEPYAARSPTSRNPTRGIVSRTRG